MEGQSRPGRLGAGHMSLWGPLIPSCEKVQNPQARKITDSHSWLETIGAKNPMELSTQKAPAQWCPINHSRRLLTPAGPLLEPRISSPCACPAQTANSIPRNSALPFPPLLLQFFHQICSRPAVPERFRYQLLAEAGTPARTRRILSRSRTMPMPLVSYCGVGRLFFNTQFVVWGFL